MKRWGFWDTDKCPCCLTEPEQDSTHIFYCNMPEMVKFRSELYSEVAQWMGEVSTHPQLQDMLIKALEGAPKVFTQGNYTDWNLIQRHFCTIPQIHLMQGLIPIGLQELQQAYYTQLRSWKKGRTWARKLCEKLMDATHALWIKRNYFEHDRGAHWLREIEDIRLEEAVRRQYSLGTEGLHTSDHYLFNKPRLELWSYPGEYVRSWLATVLIARGEHASAKQEMSQYLGDKGRCRKRTAPEEM